MPEPANTSVNPLQTLLSSLVLGAPLVVDGDCYVPILRPPSSSAGPRALLLEEGIAQGVTAVSEVDRIGRVGTVRIGHAGDLPLVVMLGEQIVGAKQNRVFDASFVVQPGTTVDAAVSCVERKRWDTPSDLLFRTAHAVMPTSTRVRKVSRIARAAQEGRTPDDEQADTWRDVDAYLGRSGVYSRTASLEDGIGASLPLSARDLREMAPQRDQIGMALVRDGRVQIVELLGSADLYRRAHTKIALGMLADARTARSSRHAGSAGIARRLVGSLLTADEATTRVREVLRRARRAVVTRTPCTGASESLHAETEGIALSAAFCNGSAYHLVVAAV